MVEIDGSFGEGGGQILRTALSLSCFFLKPFRIFNIRKNRKRPGLMPQHLTCVRAAQLISNAEVAGDKIGSSELVFNPQNVKGGELFFDIGTAGSTSLVLQTIIPSLVFSKETFISHRDTKENENVIPAPCLPAGRKAGIQITKEMDARLSPQAIRRGEKTSGMTEKRGFSNERTRVILKGGTHVPFSPPFDYIAGVFAPILERLGIKIELKIESYGFYPRGGGEIIAEIFPAKNIKPLRITERGRITRIRGYSGVGNLPLSIAKRQKDAMIEEIHSEIKDLKFPVEIEMMNVLTPGQGTFIYLQSESENAIAGFTALGKRGKRAEAVGEETAMDFIEYYSTYAAFDRHLPDQIVLYLSMSGEESVFTTSCITQHLLTNLQVIGLFHKFYYSIDGEIGRSGSIKIYAD